MASDTTKATYYTRAVGVPATKREGLANAIQLAINALEAGDAEGAMLRMVDLLDAVAGESNPYDLRGPAVGGGRKPAKRKGRGKLPAPRFKPGDRVRIAPHCTPYEGVYKPGDEATVRRVFWGEGGGGQPGGWVCGVDLGRPGHEDRTFWESLLVPAGGGS